MTKITFPIAQVWGILTRNHPHLPEKFKNPEIAFSFPMLKERKQGLEIGYFSYPVTLLGNRVIIEKPFAIITIKWENNSIKSLSCNENLKEFSSIKPEFPVEQILEQKQTRISKERIYTAYTPVINLFPDQPAGEPGKTLFDLLSSVINPVLMPYYLAMPGKFMDWLQK